MSTISRMPLHAKNAVTAALRSVGYTDAELEYEYRFDPQYDGPPETAPADIVAFYGAPHDQSTAAVATRWLSNGQDRAPYLEALGRSLWVPYTIVAAPDNCELWETFPSHSPTDQLSPVRLATGIPYADLRTALTTDDRRLGPAAVETSKRQWRQAALYEADAEPNAFFRWAYLPTRERLTDILSAVFREAKQRVAPNSEFDAAQLRWLLRLIGVRIAWDKHWFDPGTRTSGSDIRAGAVLYPTDLTSEIDAMPEGAEDLADVVATRLGSIHLGAADGGLLSQLLQEGSIPRNLQQEWKLFPTPQHVAWRMVMTLPFESIPEHRRIVWDGTCGSGTILVAALERLRSLVPTLSPSELREYLIHAITGNDIAPALADASRIALDLALGAPVAQGWRIGIGDIANAAVPTVGFAPTIIVGNPPFRGTGRVPDTAISVVGGYIDALPEGGLLSVVVPRSLLATDAARTLRKRLLAQLAVHEVWELPKGTFQCTDQETAVLMGRKRFADEAAPFAVAWRRLPKGGGQQDVDAVAQADWLRDADAVMRPPLAFRLDTHFGHFATLIEYVPRSNRSQGITPGVNGRNDILDYPEPGAVPYLSGRQYMQPFTLPWKTRPCWLRYSSPRIQWPRRSYAELFQSRKMFISRHATWESAWRVRAAIDADSIFPSDQFIVMVPMAPLSMEFMTGLFNSSLANCWIRLTNPSNTINVHQLLRLPVPRDLGSSKVARVEDIARSLAEIRRPGSDTTDGRLADFTLSLDAATYDAYEVPYSLRREITEHFLWLGDRRDGFDSPMVEMPDDSPSFNAPIMSDEDAQRMHELFEDRLERSLSSSEEAELDGLVDLWQRAYAEKVVQLRLLPQDRRYPAVADAAIPT